MFIRKNLAGMKFGCYTVMNDRISKPQRHGTRTYWRCKCDCGCEYYKESYSIVANKNEYCPACKPSGVRNERLYHVFHGMIQRCENTKNPNYYLYGQKGVKVCSEWRENYQTFKTWAYQNGYDTEHNLTIDRIDSDGDYCPSNCQWISLSENSIKADVGRVKSHSKLNDVYAISPDGERIAITNIAAFQREHSDITLPSIHAILNGRMPAKHKGWVFHSNKTRPIEV